MEARRGGPDLQGGEVPVGLEDGRDGSHHCRGRHRCYCRCCRRRRRRRRSRVPACHSLHVQGARDKEQVLEWGQDTLAVTGIYIEEIVSGMGSHEEGDRQMLECHDGGSAQMLVCAAHAPGNVAWACD